MTVDKITISLKDYKGTIVAIIIALAGFLWNKVESYLTQDTQMKMGESTFIYFQKRIDKLQEKLDLCSCSQTRGKPRGDIRTPVTSSKPHTTTSKPTSEVVTKALPSKIEFKKLIEPQEPKVKIQQKSATYKDIFQYVKKEDAPLEASDIIEE